MAILPQGILGALSGRVGPVSGYQRYGKNILRTAKTTVNIKNTPARASQRQKISICNQFTSAFSGTGFFNKTFPAYGHSGSGYNRATSAIMNRAIDGTGEGKKISFPHVLISHGPLPSAEDVLAVKATDGPISFTWTDNSNMGTAKANDKVILVAFFPEINQAFFSIGAARRGDGKALLEINEMQGYIAETWIGFLSNEEMDAADSVHAGKVIL